MKDINKIFTYLNRIYETVRKDWQSISNSSADKIVSAFQGKEKFYDIAREFGESIAIEYKKVMDSSTYKNKSDEEKKKMLDSAMEAKYKSLMQKYGIKYQ